MSVSAINQLISINRFFRPIAVIKNETYNIGSYTSQKSYCQLNFFSNEKNATYLIKRVFKTKKHDKKQKINHFE